LSNFKPILLLFCCFCLFAISWAQPNSFNSYSIKTLTPDDGLSQGSNYFRFEDSKGFMWITANDAVNRYDGSFVKVYNLNRYFKKCPNLQQGYGFAEDDNSNIYIGSVRGLYIYNRNTDKFTLQKIYSNTTDEIAMPFGFNNGKVWCFNKNYEIATYNIVTAKVEYVTKLPIAPLSSVHIYDLEGNIFYYRWPFFDKNNTIWFVGKTEIVKFNSKTKEASIINSLQANKPIYFSSFYDSISNDLLLGTNNGLIIYNTNTAQQKQIKTIEGIGLKEILAVSGNKNITVFRESGRLLILNKQTGVYFKMPNPVDRATKLFAFGFDKANRLWMCDDGAGQVIYNFSPPLLPKFPEANTATAQVEKFGVAGFAEFSNGNMIIPNSYFFYKDKNIFEHNDYGNYFKNFTGLRTETDRIRKGIWVSDLTYVNHKLNIFFATDIKSPILKYSINETDKLGSLQQIKVLDDSRLLASFSDGLYWLQNQAAVKVQNQPYKNPFTINKISNNKCAISYLNNDMWLAAFTNTDEIRFVQKILPGIQSFYLQQDTVHNQYWVGTNKGVYLLDKNFKEIRLFDANNGLTGTYIYGLLLDDEGNAWCSHQRGLSSINIKTFQIVNYNKSDGIQDWDFNNRAFYKSTNGTLYFGGINGFNYFKPPLKPFVFYKPQIYVDEILVNDQSYFIDTNANLIQQLNLSYKQNNISIKALVNDLGNENKSQLIYRIKEKDSKWNYLSPPNLITFNSLAPGNYTVQMGIYDKFTGKETVQKTILIKLSAPFYFEVWFWVLSAILITAFFFWLYNRRKLAQQKTAFQQQIALEQQRNKITADLHDDIGASLSSLQLNSAVANQLVNKDAKLAKQVLDKIETQAKNIADKIGDIIWSMKPGKDEFMTISSRIKNFANDILGATNINYTMQIDKKADTEIKDIGCRKNIVLITKEALNNAVKYSGAANITIKLKIENHKILLSITDDGVGFIVNGTTGNGIANMKKRTEELNGIFSLTTEEKKGTAINCKIPLTQ
jgi:signal transduction histidine kinase